MTKKVPTTSLVELAKAKAVVRARCWMDVLSKEERDEIYAAVEQFKNEKLPITCLAEALIEKYDLKVAKESVARTITQRAKR